jgi:hypothetical protein
MGTAQAGQQVENWRADLDYEFVWDNHEKTLRHNQEHGGETMETQMKEYVQVVDLKNGATIELPYVGTLLVSFFAILNEGETNPIMVPKTEIRDRAYIDVLTVYKCRGRTDKGVEDLYWSFDSLGLYPCRFQAK